MLRQCFGPFLCINGFLTQLFTDTRPRFLQSRKTIYGQDIEATRLLYGHDIWNHDQWLAENIMYCFLSILGCKLYYLIIYHLLPSFPSFHWL